jgi:dihydrofolate reductase
MHATNTMQTVSIIAAMDNNRAIGNRGTIPWHLPADFAHFKQLTLGHSVIMGRKTYESIGKPLPGRKNIIITRQFHYRADGCVLVESFSAALAAAGYGESFVIGGAEVYREAIPFVRRMYLTLVDGEFPADTYFPEFDRSKWREIERVPCSGDEKNLHAYSFVTLERI